MKQLMNKDLISVIVPAYNVSKYLRRCLDSILIQDYSNLEIIVVNDGSTDNTGEIAELYANNYDNVFLINKNNEGLGFARNTGIARAKGNFIMFIDSDDYIEERYISALYDRILETNSDACISGFKRVYNNYSVEFPVYNYEKVFSGEEIIRDFIPKLFGKDPEENEYYEMSVWKVLFKTSFISNNNLRFPSERVLISEDINFDLQYYPLCNKICFIKQTGYCYCDNEASLTTKYRANKVELLKVQYNEMLNKASNLGIIDKSMNRICNYLISNIRSCIKQEQQFIKRKEAINNIKIIVDDAIIHKAIMNFNGKKTKFSNKFINKLILKKKYRTLYFFFGLKKILKV